MYPYWYHILFILVDSILYISYFLICLLYLHLCYCTFYLCFLYAYFFIVSLFNIFIFIICFLISFILCLSMLQERVRSLYKFRDHYFEAHSLDDASNKLSDVEKELEKTLELFNEYKGEYFRYRWISLYIVGAYYYT